LPKDKNDEDFFILTNNPYFTALEKIVFYEKALKKLDDIGDSNCALNIYIKKLDAIVARGFCGGRTAYHELDKY